MPYFFILCVGSLSILWIMRLWQKYYPKQEYSEAQGENTSVLEALMQANIMGDVSTAKAINSNTYDGPLPERRSDGAWTSIYDGMRIMKIAGLNYRGDLAAYVGQFNGILKAEPTNEYDPGAIMVKCEDGRHLGYIKEYQTDMVRWMIGAPPYSGPKSAVFPPYRITGYITQKTDERDGHQFFDGYVYVKQHR